ncbi:MAG TPA: hypothetical protein VMP01_23935 [Pirellulaceae bacterium]|nr:hypothetical protein [Pirellulaceae bacterium]
MPDSLDPNLPPLRRPVSRGAWAFGCLGTFVLIVVLGGSSVWLYFRGRHQQAARAVQAEVDRIHAAGEPITTEDMVKFHRVSEGVFDATQLWIDAIQAAAAVEDPNEATLWGPGQLADLSADSPASLLPVAEKFLAANAEAIDKTRKAAAAGGQCRYPVDFSQGINSLLPHIQDARGLARVLSLRLDVAVERQDVAAALESLELELALAATMDHEPTLVAQLVRMADVGIAFQDLRAMISELPLTDAQLAGLQRRIEAIDAKQSAKDGLLGERAMGYHTFHHLSQLEGLEILAGEDGTLQRPGDLCVYLGLMREMIEAADEPPAQARITGQRVEDKLRVLVGKQNPLERLETVVTTQLFPATSRFFDAAARTQALRDSAVGGIAFRRHQLKHGKAPDSLAALVPEYLPAVPLDPFAPVGTPLTLASDGQHYAIYSVGQDGRDDRALLSDADSADDHGFVAKLAVPGKSDSSAAPAGANE